jgi:class I lanthipeptide synthase
MSSGLCLRFCFDTYDREVERYGGEVGTATAEALFAADSCAVVELLSLSQQHLLEMDQMTLAVLSIDDLLAGLGLTESARLHWYKDQVTSRHESGQEYRQRKQTLRSLLGDPTRLLGESGGEAVAQVFAARREALVPAAQHLDKLTEQGEIGQPPSKLYQSFVHLHCNRLLASDGSLEQRLIGLLLRTREGLHTAPPHL